MYYYDPQCSGQRRHNQGSCGGYLGIRVWIHIAGTILDIMVQRNKWDNIIPWPWGKRGMCGVGVASEKCDTDLSSCIATQHVNTLSSYFFAGSWLLRPPKINSLPLRFLFRHIDKVHKSAQPMIPRNRTNIIAEG